jgi:Domain of unknown function (DUF397)
MARCPPIAPGAGEHAAEAAGERVVTGKPTVADLGIDVTAQSWRRSGAGAAGSIEIAVVRQPVGAGDEWVLMRVAGDPVERVLVYDRHEWECFLDGVRNGEFDDAFD